MAGLVPAIHVLRTGGIGVLLRLVMPGLVPGVHVLVHLGKKGVDGRDKPGHDEKRI